MSDFAGTRVLVVGLGVSGASAARALHDLGAHVRVTDSAAPAVVVDRADRLRAAGIEVETGGHDLSKMDFDLAIVSPGIPPSSAIVRALDDAGITWFSEVELAYRLAQCDFLAVTGTNGKTTTTTLLAGILQEAGITTAAAGNIGLPLIDAIASVPEGGAIAVEVSSFQLAATEEFHPRVAVILNIAEDHTDWHGSVEEYARAKARIFRNQTTNDFLVPNANDQRVMDLARMAHAQLVPYSGSHVPADGIGVAGNDIMWQGRRIFDVHDIPLPGSAGIEDAVAAAGAALCYGVDERAVVRGIKGFRALGHRLEVVAEADDVTYIDDSKATNPHATLAAVRGLTDVVLIAGGRSKGIDLTVLADVVPPVTAVVALGEARAQIEEIFGRLVPVERADSMEDAVRLASKHAIPGGSVLLSPACASLDMYESYAHRGEEFARAVRDLLDARGSGDGDR
ncbi:MAG: UDP-N-acetylmuramoyl-L-alanine--D-glutamate ligase [Actinobacteria bacterium]|nr:UDP-N-acetylmuramoyl-L-alanine--D-glutamate ligase [Actinomycetota bacterium]